MNATKCAKTKIGGTPVMRDNRNKWKTHFQDMARGKIQTNNLYFLNKKGRCLGTNPKGHALYRVQTGGQSISLSLPSPENGCW